MASFEFRCPEQVTFGNGCLNQVGETAARYGQRAMVAAGQRSADLERLLDFLSKSNVTAQVLTVRGEPTVPQIEQAVTQARAFGVDLVIGFGGGSALDSAKAISALLTNPGDPLDYLEVVGRGKPLTQRALPCICIPTTAGTGSEVTRNAVLAVPEKGVKVSLRSGLMMPSVALVDPELTYSLPKAITAATGMDALTQVIEPYVSRRANLLTDEYCRAGMLRAGRSLRRAVDSAEGQVDVAVREDMAFASLMGGLALANAGLGAVHGFAGVIGGQFSAPHGAICAALLPGVVQVNARALAERHPQAVALSRYAEIAHLLTGNPTAEVVDLVAWLEELKQALAIPPLRAYGLKEEHVAEIVAKSAAASSMKANPLDLTSADLSEILRFAI